MAARDLLSRASEIYGDLLDKDHHHQKTSKDLKAFTQTRLAAIEYRKNTEIKIQVDGEKSRPGVLAIDVILPDQSFLIKFIRSFLRQNNFEIITLLHPTFTIDRKSGKLKTLKPAEPGEQNHEACIYIEIGASKDQAGFVKTGLRRLLVEAQAISRDYESIISDINLVVGLVTDSENQKFLDWIKKTHFVIVGAIRGVQDKTLGAISLENYQESLQQLVKYRNQSTTGQETIQFQHLKSQSFIYKARHQIAIHISYRQQGRAMTLSILGFFTESIYSTYASHMPIIGSKLQRILADSGELPESYEYKLIRHMYDQLHIEVRLLYPAELLSAHIRVLRDAILHDQIKSNILLKDKTASFFLIYPRNNWKQRVYDNLLDALRIQFGTEISTRVSLFEEHTIFQAFVTGLKAGFINGFNEQRQHEFCEYMLLTAKTWQSQLDELVETSLEKDELKVYNEEFHKVFVESYQKRFGPGKALADVIQLITLLGQPGKYIAKIHSVVTSHADLSLYSKEEITLSNIMPIFGNLAITVLEQRVEKIQLRSKDHYIYQFRLQTQKTGAEFYKKEKKICEALLALLEKRISDDSLNSLVLTTDLAFEHVALLQFLRGHLMQLFPRYSKNFINQALTQYVEFSEYLVSAYIARLAGNAASSEADQQKARLIENVETLAQEELLLLFDDLVSNVIRSNFKFYKSQLNRENLEDFKQAEIWPYLCHKLNTQNMVQAPPPRPMFEIFVYSPQFEGIHLRGGRIARGGLRLSDRHDDYRSEVLDLVHTQMKKNTLIVPVGSKGGFILKEQEGDRTTLVQKAYRSFIHALLTLTDNLNKRPLFSKRIEKLDPPDHYLVVAADKGTASFSDIANAVSENVGYWLGDAFASGGQTGYNHKDCGITARGAWESGKHHLQKLGINQKTDAFTVVAIGDMSGDVFGNGLLYSKKIRLLGAFNHQHIFIDPSADGEKGFAERQRLFNLPRSSWADYNTSLISPGGGIFDRHKKRINLPHQAAKLLGLANEASPAEIIRALLKLEVDLIFFGGIGTYIKSERESHRDAQDRSNDDIRVNANELKTRVIVEGANLGMTMPARLDASSAGILLNTDALDNSGGVNLSDQEVNLKILLDSRDNLDKKARNRHLKDIKSEVIQRVLKNNHDINDSLTLDEMRIQNSPALFFAAYSFLQSKTAFSPEVEKITDLATLQESNRIKKFIARPVLALLNAFSKAFIKELLGKDNSILVKQKPLEELFMVKYFPPSVRESFHKEIVRHPLRKSIAITMLVNVFTNELGVSQVGLFSYYDSPWIRQYITIYFQLRSLFSVELMASEKLDARYRTYEGLRWGAFIFCELDKKIISEAKLKSIEDHCNRVYEQLFKKKPVKARVLAEFELLSYSIILAPVTSLEQDIVCCLLLLVRPDIIRNEIFSFAGSNQSEYLFKKQLVDSLLQSFSTTVREAMAQNQAKQKQLLSYFRTDLKRREQTENQVFKLKVNRPSELIEAHVYLSNFFKDLNQVITGS